MFFGGKQKDGRDKKSERSESTGDTAAEGFKQTEVPAAPGVIYLQLQYFSSLSFCAHFLFATLTL